MKKHQCQQCRAIHTQNNINDVLLNNYLKNNYFLLKQKKSVITMYIIQESPTITDKPVRCFCKRHMVYLRTARLLYHIHS